MIIFAQHVLFNLHQTPLPYAWRMATRGPEAVVQILRLGMNVRCKRCGLSHTGIMVVNISLMVIIVMVMDHYGRRWLMLAVRVIMVMPMMCVVVVVTIMVMVFLSLDSFLAGSATASRTHNPLPLKLFHFQLL
jgi:hypothetical protein